MQFRKTELKIVQLQYKEYHLSINGGFDDFFEDIIREANHY